MLKKLTTEPPVLRHPDPERTFKLFVDASNISVGAVLSQQFEDGEYPCLFYSRRLAKAEENYATSEKEFLALVTVTKKFRKYLLGKRFTTYTDNNAVKLLLNKKDLIQRMHRWILQLAEYAMDIKHISGTKNIVADFLSRYNLENRLVHEELYLSQGSDEKSLDYEEELQ